MKSLLLDQTAWDLVLDAGGDIAVASEPYALAQDAASEIKTFQGEVYYDTSKGLPYFQRILGKRPSAQLIKTQFVEAAMLVPGVISAACFLTSAGPRNIGGQVQITDAAGVTLPTPALPL